MFWNNIHSTPPTSLLIFVFIATFSGCATTETNIVSGRLMGPSVPSPTDAIIYTQPAGAGVQITSSAEGGRNPAALSGPEVVRLVNRIEEKLKDWDDFDGSDPFEETLMIGLAGTSAPQPFVVKLAKVPPMEEPVFIVTLAYRDAVASVALDRENAGRWTRQLRQAINY
jgi:hypothetical protein